MTKPNNPPAFREDEYNAGNEIEQFGKDIAKLKHHSAHGKALLLWRMGYRFKGTHPPAERGKTQ